MNHTRPPLTKEPTITVRLALTMMNMAERELVAFISAVTELFGCAQARLSAADWLDELLAMDCLPGAKSRDWRVVTVAAVARLASRLTAALHYRTPLVTPTDTRVLTDTIVQ